MIKKRMTLLADAMAGDYLFGPRVSVADCYLFVMLRWAQKNIIAVPDRLVTFRDQMMQRPSVQTAMKHGGLA